MEKVYYIYLLFDTRALIGYVGKSCNPQRRAKSHWAERFDGDTYKHRWLRKLEVPPQLVILQKCTEKSWPKWEKIWIRDLRLGRLVLVNTAPGGWGVSEHTEDTKRKMSETKKRRWANGEYGVHYHKGRPRSEATKRKISLANKGQKPSLQTRKRLSISAKKRVQRPDYINPFTCADVRKKMSEAKIGTHRTEETKKRISESLTGIKRSKSTRQKISNALTGHLVSEHTRKKIRKTVKASWRNQYACADSNF